VLAIPPGSSPEDLQRLADWVEASVLVSDGSVSKSSVMEELRASGLVALPDESFGEDAEEFGSGSDENSDDSLERLVDDVLAECRQRQNQLGDGYPFQMSADLLSLRGDVERDSYAFLLVSDLGHHFVELKDALTPDTHSGMLMEKVVEAATRGIFGRSQRFGWPREQEWPTGIKKRVKRLAKELGVPVDSLKRKVVPADNDRTLDVVAIMSLDDTHEASLIVLVQCAAGQNWKSKLGDPSIAAWDNLLQWQSPIVRAVALPWRLGGRQSDWTYGRVYSMSNHAMVLDRPRLLAGRPDTHLDARVRPQLNDWWTSAIAKIPNSLST